MEQHTIADDLAAEVRDACLGMGVARLHRVVALVRVGVALVRAGTADRGLAQPQTAGRVVATLAA
jgi:hypothetical protein